MKSKIKFLYQIIFYFFVAVSFSACSTNHRPIIDYPLIEQETNLKNLARKYDVRLKWDSITQVVTLTKNNMQAKVLINSEMVIIDNKRIILDEPIRMQNSEILVSYDFKGKVIDALMNQSKAVISYSVPKVNRIIIDPGHGGKDPGAIGKAGTQEKDVVLDISKRMARYLKSKGVDVILTRNDDTFISLQERTEIASDKKADLFVSIHANSSPAKSAQGMEIFTAKELGQEDFQESQRQINQQKYFKNLKMKANDSVLNFILEDMLYDYKQSESKKFAGEVLNKTTRELKNEDRGIKTARFYVLRNTISPAILIETAFLSNLKEEKLLANKAYRNQLAESLAKTLLEYIK